MLRRCRTAPRQVLLVSEKILKQFNLTPLARFCSYAVAGVPPEDHGHRPGGGDPQGAGAGGHPGAATSTGSSSTRTFAAQGAGGDARSRARPNTARVNQLGGAIALGHPRGDRTIRTARAGAQPSAQRQALRDGQHVHRHRHERGRGPHCSWGAHEVGIALKRLSWLPNHWDWEQSLLEMYVKMRWKLSMRLKLRNMSFLCWD